MAGYVFLDRVLDCEPGVRISGLKALAYNEEFFRDHFPGKPVLPGAMILEGFVQAARQCLAMTEGGHERWTLHEVGGMRFNRFAVPGEVLKLEAEFEKSDNNAQWFKGRASVEGTGVCRLRFALTEYDHEN
ncbi:MAG: 3-hydroxyacyl-ACP dehydratase FabZ family protein [Planctomycetota bacterium]